MRDDVAAASLVELSGPLALPLLALALVALVLVLVIGRRVWAAGRHGDEVLQRIALLGREDRIDDARRVVRETPGAVSDVARAGLDAPDAEQAARAMDAAALDARRRLARGIRLLDWTGALAVLVPAAALVLGDDARAALAALALGLVVAAAVVVARWLLVAAVRRAGIEMVKGAGVVLGIHWDGAASR